MTHDIRIVIYIFGTSLQLSLQINPMPKKKMPRFQNSNLMNRLALDALTSENKYRAVLSSTQAVQAPITVYI